MLRIKYIAKIPPPSPSIKPLGVNLKKTKKHKNRYKMRATRGLSENQIMEIKNFFQHIQNNIQKEMV